MNEKTLMDVLIYTEKNFNGIERAFKGVSRSIKAQGKTINKICMLSGIGFLCSAALFNIQNKQIIALQNQVKRLEEAREAEKEDETDAEI